MRSPNSTFALRREPGKQRGILEDEHPRRIGAAYPLSAGEHIAFAGRVESRDEVEQCALPTPRRSHDADEVAVANREIGAVECPQDIAVAQVETAGYAAKVDAHCHVSDLWN
jgi:hypothetical protein